MIDKAAYACLWATRDVDYSLYKTKKEILLRIFNVATIVTFSIYVDGTWGYSDYMDACTTLLKLLLLLHQQLLPICFSLAYYEH